MIDDLPNEIYDHDSEEKERADAEIEALERNEKERADEWVEVIERAAREEEIEMNLINENLKKIYGILGLPK